MIYVNKIENRITFQIKAGYFLELLTPETSRNLPHLEISRRCQQPLTARFESLVYIFS